MLISNTTTETKWNILVKKYSCCKLILNYHELRFTFLFLKWCVISPALLSEVARIADFWSLVWFIWWPLVDINHCSQRTHNLRDHTEAIHIRRWPQIAVAKHHSIVNSQSGYLQEGCNNLLWLKATTFNRSHWPEYLEAL